MTAGAFDYVPLERVRWGVPAAEAACEEAERLGAGRVFIVASGTLARKTEAIDNLRKALGGRDAGLFDQCREHAPLESIIACAEAARAANPDLILTIGGGTPIDTVKIVQLCLTHDIRDTKTLLGFSNKTVKAPSRVRQVIIPTTLSGGAYSNIAGGMDAARKSKEGFAGSDLCGRVIILDPEITQHTPEWLWLSTGIRALDHAVEGYCAPRTNPLVQATALHAMTLFARALRQTKNDPADTEARQQSQMAEWLASGSLGRVSMGASHGIGYVLGGYCGVPHGYTSCVMLPAVLRWNAPVLGAMDKAIATALGMRDATASEAVGALLDALGMPRKLGDVGVTANQIPEIASRAARHPVVRANVRPIQNAGDVEAILALAA